MSTVYCQVAWSGKLSGMRHVIEHKDCNINAHASHMYVIMCLTQRGLYPVPSQEGLLRRDYCREDYKMLA